MKKAVRIVLIVILGLLVLGFIGIQFVPVVRTNPPVTAPLAAGPAVQAVLRTSCYDCHSNETVWPWYSMVAPVSWLVVEDVSEGRGHLNFSEWADLGADLEPYVAAEIMEEIEDGGMPLAEYVKMHPGAEVTPEEYAILAAWADEFGASTGGDEPDEDDDRDEERPEDDQAPPAEQ